MSLCWPAVALLQGGPNIYGVCMCWVLITITLTNFSCGDVIPFRFKWKVYSSLWIFLHNKNSFCIIHCLQELPYHLEQLLDNNRLIKCLLNWPVFERLFSEDFSIDLLRSWQKVCSPQPQKYILPQSLT